MTAEDLSPVSKVTEYISPTLSTPAPTSVLLSRVLWTGLWSKKQDQVRFLEQKMNRCVRVRYWWPRSPNRREVGGRGGGVQSGVLTERAQLVVHVFPDRSAGAAHLRLDHHHLESKRPAGASAQGETWSVCAAVLQEGLCWLVPDLYTWHPVSKWHRTEHKRLDLIV